MGERSDFAIKLVFVKSAKESEREKLKDLWQFIGQHPELQPYLPLRPPSEIVRERRDEARKSTQTEDFEVETVPEAAKIRTIASFVPEKCPGNRIFRSKSQRLAYEIEETYEELNNELVAFDKRINSAESPEEDSIDEDSWEEATFALIPQDLLSNH